MKLFYARVSTEQQNEERQIKAATDLGIEREHIYIDKQSGKNAERKALKEVLADRDCEEPEEDWNNNDAQKGVAVSLY